MNKIRTIVEIVVILMNLILYFLIHNKLMDYDEKTFSFVFK